MREATHIGDGAGEGRFGGGVLGTEEAVHGGREEGRVAMRIWRSLTGKS